MQYDNSSSQVGKGVAFHRHRFEIQLRKYYEREGTNEGYIGFSDFSGYYDNIVHEVALAQFSQYLAREIKDPEELADVMDKLRLAFRTFELDVSRFADEEIEKMYHEKVRSTLNVGVPSSADGRENDCGRAQDIGNQVSQNTGIFLPVPIDNYVKIVCAVKGYGRYSDDFYIIDKSKEHLREVMAGVRQWGRKSWESSSTKRKPVFASCPASIAICKCFILCRKMGGSSERSAKSYHERTAEAQSL